MKKIIAVLLCFCLMLSLTACAKDGIKNTINGNIRTYYEMSDGTWVCNDVTYKDRLEIKGRLANGVKDTVYVYLSNVPITFEQAWKASGLASDLTDYFPVEDAVFVEIRAE